VKKKDKEDKGELGEKRELGEKSHSPLQPVSFTLLPRNPKTLIIGIL
jgi:hypothetical protein